MFVFYLWIYFFYCNFKKSYLNIIYIYMFIPYIYIVYMYIYIYIYIYIYTIYIYGINHRRIFRSSYRKTTWMGFKPMTTEFHWDALTDWAIRPWVQLALSQLCTALHFHLFVQCSHFISAIAFIVTFALSEISHR